MLIRIGFGTNHLKMSEVVNIEKKYRIGELDQRVQILAPTETQGTNGEITQTWGEYATRWASVSPLGGSESVLGDMMLPVSRARFVFRYDGTITEKFRFVWNSHTYNIVSIDVVPRNRFLIVIAESTTLSGSEGVDYGNYYATNSLRLRFIDNAGTAIDTEASVTTATGLTAVQAGAGYIALIRYQSPTQYFYTLVTSDGAHWAIWNNDNVVLR